MVLYIFFPVPGWFFPSFLFLVFFVYRLFFILLIVTSTICHFILLVSVDSSFLLGSLFHLIFLIFSLSFVILRLPLALPSSFVFQYFQTSFSFVVTVAFVYFLVRCLIFLYYLLLRFNSLPLPLLSSHHLLPLRSDLDSSFFNDFSSLNLIFLFYFIIFHFSSYMPLVSSSIYFMSCF